jgi:hypothetical protein
MSISKNYEGKKVAILILKFSCWSCQRQWGKEGDYEIPFYNEKAEMDIKKICKRCHDENISEWEKLNCKISKCKKRQSQKFSSLGVKLSVKSKPST